MSVLNKDEGCTTCWCGSHMLVDEWKEIFGVVMLGSAVRFFFFFWRALLTMSLTSLVSISALFGLSWFSLPLLPSPSGPSLLLPHYELHFHRSRHASTTTCRGKISRWLLVNWWNDDSETWGNVCICIEKFRILSRRTKVWQLQVPCSEMLRDRVCR